MADRIQAKFKFILSHFTKQHNTFHVARTKSSNMTQDRLNTTFTNISNEMILPLCKFDIRLDKYIEEVGVLWILDRSYTSICWGCVNKNHLALIFWIDDGLIHQSSYPYIGRTWCVRHSRFTLISTGASKSAFCIGGRILNNFRNSLSPENVEILICT